MALLAAACAIPAIAQDYAKKLADTTAVYNDGKVENACIAYRQLYNEKHDEQVKSMEAAACSDMDFAYKTAERLFQEGMELKKQGKCEEAKTKLRASPLGGQPIPLKEYKHKDEVDKALAEVCAGGTGGNTPPPAGPELLKQAQAEQSSGNCQAALLDIETFLRIKPGYAPAEALRRTIQRCVEEQPLRAGLKEFFKLQYDEANSHLGEYIDKKGPQKDLALFFRGAVQGSRFLLSGERATHYKDDAFRDFKALSAGFTPPTDLLSPRILDLFKQARSAAPQ